jgi:hypothetical protein
VGKFSSSTRGNAYSLEFWMNLSLYTKSLAAGPTSRIGESEIVGISGNSSSGLYIRDLDYLVFKIGKIIVLQILRAPYICRGP